MTVLRVVPLADVALALIRKDFVSGSNPASHDLLRCLTETHFNEGGRLLLSRPVSDIQAELFKCRLAGVPCDWNRAYRLLVLALSDAGHLRLDVPCDGQTLSWSSFTRTHAEAVLNRDLSSPFTKDVMDSSMSELADFARAQDISERVFESARDSLRVASVNRVKPDDVSGSPRHFQMETWCTARGTAAGRFVPTT
mmetsp:Transcript_40053/g.89877  ORF Transcript_40053/g.89877 Transcript_40053/m.89877 type:complete len:196 (+) Transcript_40053:415-1002(+)